MDGGLCSQTVTLYRKTGERTVVEHCLYTHRTEEISDVYGTRQERKFLLIVPEGTPLQVGDRVIEGIGPETVDWKTFLPVLVPGLGEIAYVKALPGVLPHKEAGRK